MPSPAARPKSVPMVSSKMNRAECSPRSAALTIQRRARVVLPQPAGPISKVLCSAPQSSSSQRVEFRNSTTRLAGVFAFVTIFSRYEPREDNDSAVANKVIMKPFTECGASQLCHFKPPDGFSVVTRESIHGYDAVHDAVQLEIRITAAAVIQKHYRAIFRRMF